MDPDRWEQAKSIFSAAVEVEGPARAALVRERCGADEDLRQEVERLLAAHERPTVQPDPREPAAGAGPGGWGKADRGGPETWTTAASPFLRASDRIGSYRVLRVLGEGGMGIVYLAEQERPRRTVALKMIRPGIATPAMLRRFEHEAQVLGRLQHPGIAQVYEAGTANTGMGPQPYFAMEYVRGKPLLEYAAEHKLGTRARLELFAKVCDAVQHAHQKGVIHRDLKPGNILVDEDGKGGQPKVLDFGVARAIDSDIQATTVAGGQTDVGQLIGTLPYMSPEQAEGRADDLDTRSDVYSLGVIVYEMLAGRLPYELGKKLVHEAVRVIREDPPTRLSSINRTLRGDIETIAGKALEKDRTRRYQSAGDLGGDVRRYLASEPIVARPPTVGYQVRKFATRHKGLVGGIIAVLLVLLLGIAGTTIGLVLESRQRSLAERNEKDAKDQADIARKAQAAEKARADELKEVSDFQAEMLEQIEPSEAGIRLTADVATRFAAALQKSGTNESERAAQTEEFTRLWQRINATDAARELIDATILRPAVAAVDTKFASQPVVAAMLRQVLADRYVQLGLYDAATPLQLNALETRRRFLGDDHPDTISSINQLGELYRMNGKLAEAEVAAREALERCRRVLGEDHPNTIGSTNNLGIILQARGRWVDAEPYLRAALQNSRRTLGEDHPDTLRLLNNLGHAMSSRGSPTDAETLLREAVQRRRRALGEEHPDTLISINNLGLLLQRLGRHEEAEACLHEALEKRRRVLGEIHPGTLTSLNNLGEVFMAQGHWADAEACYREAMEKRRRVLGIEHPYTLDSICNVGTVLLQMGRLEESERYSSEALTIRRRVLGDDHPDTLISINNMGSLRRRQGRFEEAEALCREVLQSRRRVLGEEHPSTLASTVLLGMLLTDEGSYDEAIDLLSSAEPAARRVFVGGNAVRLEGLLLSLGRARASLAFDAVRFSAAERNLIEAHQIVSQRFGSGGKEPQRCAEALVALYDAWDAADPGRGFARKAAEWREKAPNAPEPEVKP